MIISVGEIKEQKGGFKKSFVRVKTKELSDESHQVIRQSGEFDCEVAIGNNGQFEKLFQQLKDAAGKPDLYLPCYFILRSFWYEEKREKKLGKQLQLKRWWV